jgi:endoglucanase
MMRLALAAFTMLIVGSSIQSCKKRIERTATGTTFVDEHGALRVDGNKIVDAKNQPVQLTGMSLFWSQWEGEFYTPETVQHLRKEWHCNVVRAAMGIDMDGYLKNPDVEKEKIFTVIDAAIGEGMYVIVDWHDHHAEQHLDQAKDFFAEVAETYGEYPNVIYELYNEPLTVSWSKVLKPYFTEVIKVIREHDPDNLIVCGTPTWSQRVDQAAEDPIALPNVAYTLHFYAATHKQELRDVAKTALDKGIALMVTEFGTTEASGDGMVDEAETRLWLQFLDDHKISWCNWSICDKKESAAALKPKTDPKVEWKDKQLTRSGRLIRNELRQRNK